MKMPKYKLVLTQQTLQDLPDAKESDENVTAFYSSDTVMDVSGDAAVISGVCLSIMNQMDREVEDSSATRIQTNNQYADTSYEAFPDAADPMAGAAFSPGEEFNPLFANDSTQVDINSELGAKMGAKILGGLVGKDGLDAVLAIAELGGQGGDIFAEALRTEARSSAYAPKKATPKKRSKK